MEESSFGNGRTSGSLLQNPAAGNHRCAGHPTATARAPREQNRGCPELERTQGKGASVPGQSWGWSSPAGVSRGGSRGPQLRTITTGAYGFCRRFLLLLLFTPKGLVLFFLLPQHDRFVLSCTA